MNDCFFIIVTGNARTYFKSNPIKQWHILDSPYTHLNNTFYKYCSHLLSRQVIQLLVSDRAVASFWGKKKRWWCLNIMEKYTKHLLYPRQILTHVTQGHTTNIYYSWHLIIIKYNDYSFRVCVISIYSLWSL